MKPTRQSVSFYGFMMAINVFVGVMFYTVSVPPPVLAETPSIAVVKRPAYTQMVAAVTGVPIRLVVPSLGIDLSVATGSYSPRNDSWTVGDNKAYYADASLPANDSNGTTLLYGHAQASVFAGLGALKPGVTALVYTDTHHLFSYRYQSVRNVIPTDTSVFTENGSPTLVLQTCSGAWDKYRALHTFSFVSEKLI